MKVLKMMILAFLYPQSPNDNRYLDYLDRNYRRTNRRAIRIPVPVPIRIYNHTMNVRPYGDRPKIKKTLLSSEGSFRIEEKNANITFKDVGGYHAVKSELMQIIDILKNKTIYEEYGIRIPKGILMEGPTGNGKTLMAKAFAGEIDYSFIGTSGSEFNEKYVGVGAARIRELFEFADNNEPCIIFIDEMDAVARSRTKNDEGSGEERSHTLNQLLVSLDGFEQRKDIIMLGATNRIDILDQAILRPGRIDKIINVPNPDQQTRQEIIEIHRKKKPINVTTEEIVKMTNGLNGAQIENVLNEGVLMGLRKGELPVNKMILEEARNRMILGNSIGTKNISMNTLKRVAIHEIGHLMMALQSKNFDSPTKVTIESSIFSSLGYTMFEKSDVDPGFFLKEYLHDHLKVLLGGRVAEETIYGDSVSSGAYSDLESAFGLTKKMIMEWGMGSHIIYPHFSENYKQRIDKEIHTIINNAYRDTKQYLLENKKTLLSLSEKLLDKKTLYPEDFT